MPRTALGLCLFAAFAPLVAAQTPHDTVAAVAQAVEDNYFDATRGKRIADDLRTADARGEFDDATAPLDLATQLTAKLHPLDHHFTVRWQPPSPTAAMPGTRRAPPPTRDTGIRKVEILPGNLGLLEMRFFAGFEFADEQAAPRLAIDAALQLLAGSDALIIDLRDNGGGSPAMVGYLTSAFTPKGADIYNTFHSRSGTTSEAPLDWYPAPRLDVPVYVLVSARTGSAAEAFSYTMKNAKRAIVVGETTAGAANPGGPIDVGNGFSVFVSDGSPVSPITKKNWEGDGVAPDIETAPQDALRIAQIDALERGLAKSTDESAQTGSRWVLEALQAKAPAAHADYSNFAGNYGDVVIAAEGNALQFKQGRRPARTLLPLRAGEFFIAEDPYRRVVFEDDALELRFADGGASRYRRTAK